MNFLPLHEPSLSDMDSYQFHHHTISLPPILILFSPAFSHSYIGAAGANASGQPPLCLIDEMDLSIQCNPKFLRATVGKIVASQAAATNTRLPLGLVCKPMAGDVGTDNEGTKMLCVC